MRTPLIAGNWKMNKTHLDAIHFLGQLGHELADHDPERVEVALCPPFTGLRSVQTNIEDRHQSFRLGAQNMHWEAEGAFTGEVSPVMLKALKVDYVILGHSERREHFGESDESVNKKVKAAFSHGLVPIMCCGETEEERAAGNTETKVERQVTEGLAGVTPDNARDLVVAYEPIWAIGTGKTATPDDAQSVCGLIRKLLIDLYDQSVADEIRIQYGGSVKSGNTEALTSQADIDGALVGGASLDAAEFAAIVRATKVKG
ncbi:MAG: triose-phosphate isomerase [Actinomycetota bacterium]